jgi:aspartyl-tRNA(Asn)/glutamyl-tRNA(Gln) amidotransferase subunit A
MSMRGAENPIVSAGIVGLHALFRRGAITPVEAFEAFQGRAERLNPSLNAIVCGNGDDAATAAAASADRWRARAPLSVLDGAPIVVKANLAVAGLQHTGAIEAYADATASENATAVQRLRAAGAVIMGLANMHEAALGATTVSPLYGPAQNPLKAGHTPGGSSGGSAAAVAAGLAAGALGTDTLGSVRLPSAYCGVAGFKPSFGRVSRHGLRLLSFTLDHVGVHARHARDLLPLVAAIAGRDGRDPFTTGLARMAANPAGAATDLNGLRLGALALTPEMQVSPGIASVYERMLACLAGTGAQVEMIAWPGYDHAAMRRKGLLLAEAEGAALMAQALADRPAGFSEGLRSMFAYGAGQPAQKLAAAQFAIAETRAMTAALFERFQALVSPTAAQVAFPHSQQAPANQADFTALANFAGLPAASVPMGAADDGLPSGLQIMTPFGTDRLTLSIAEAIETADFAKS